MSGALAFVALLIVGLVIVSPGTDSRAQHRLAVSQATLAQTRDEVDALDATLLSVADFGSEWTVVNEGGLVPSRLRFSDPCASLPGLKPVATIGREISLSRNLQENGDEFGHAAMRVRLYKNADEATEQYEARANPAFTSCIAGWDTDVTNCSCGREAVTAARVERVEPPAGTLAIVYLDSVDYVSDGQPETFYFLSAYFLHGRTVGIVEFNQNGQAIDRSRIDELVALAGQRLGVHAPS